MSLSNELRERRYKRMNIVDSVIPRDITIPKSISNNRRSGSTGSSGSSYGSDSICSPLVKNGLYRVAVMGPVKVGKTSIIKQFLYEKMDNRYKSTIEDIYRGEYVIGGMTLTLDIMDTSGTNEFPAMRDLCISTSHGFVLVYNINDEQSFEEVKRLRQIIIDKKNDDNVPIVVVGNKCDSSDESRTLTREYCQNIVLNDWDNGFVESSAKEDINIIQIFKELLIQAKIQYALSPAVRRRRSSVGTHGTPIRKNGAGCVIS